MGTKHTNTHISAMMKEQARLDRKISLGRASMADINKNLALRGKIEAAFQPASIAA